MHAFYSALYGFLQNAAYEAVNKIGILAFMMHMVLWGGETHIDDSGRASLGGDVLPRFQLNFNELTG